MKTIEEIEEKENKFRESVKIKDLTAKQIYELGKNARNALGKEYVEKQLVKALGINEKFLDCQQGREIIYKIEQEFRHSNYIGRDLTFDEKGNYKGGSIQWKDDVTDSINRLNFGEDYMKLEEKNNRDEYEYNNDLRISGAFVHQTEKMTDRSEKYRGTIKNTEIERYISGDTIDKESARVKELKAEKDVRGIESVSEIRRKEINAERPYNSDDYPNVKTEYKEYINDEKYPKYFKDGYKEAGITTQSLTGIRISASLGGRSLQMYDETMGHILEQEIQDNKISLTKEEKVNRLYQERDKATPNQKKKIDSLSRYLTNNEQEVTK